MKADSVLQWCDTLYRAIQLFVPGTSEQNPPPILNVTHWVALITAFCTVAEILLAIFTQQK